MNTLKYTLHALDRMNERDISTATVDAVIASGVSTVGPRGSMRYKLEGMVVVVDGDDIVTVYFDSKKRQRGQWNPKKKQRKGRLGEMKPTYIQGRGAVNIKQQEHFMKQMEER